MSNLATLVTKAKTDPASATAEVSAFLKTNFPDLGITDCTINTGSKVSLNSVNGIITTQTGERLFYKFHAEEGEQESLTAAEYYRAKILADEGWPVIMARAVSTLPGQQCVIYPEITASTAYDLYGAQDAVFLQTGAYDEQQKAVLLNAETDYLKKTTAIILKTLQPGDAKNADASLHQLFSHRLHSVNNTTPRIDLFYTDHPVILPNGSTINFDELAQKKFVINGVAYPTTLADIIAKSKQHLHNESMANQPSCISHGDDHNGNKFLIDDQFVTFDPAFGGRHPVLLGIIKGLMHNGPLHPFWYYEPERVHDQLKVDMNIDSDTIYVTHNADKVLHSPIRDAVVKLHQDLVWKPIIAHLQEHNALPQDWEIFARCAAFCCPFLAVNMIKADRAAQAQLSIFNLAQCVGTFHTDFFAQLVHQPKPPATSFIPKAQLTL
ncbi:MAG: hypothetical protein EB059_06155 [Alphaproteobacteria bacterium]|nr:hypothetical protein [Alphaproteobacteria bacterium]